MHELELKENAKFNINTIMVFFNCNPFNFLKKEYIRHSFTSNPAVVYAQKFPMQSKDQPATSQSTSQRKKAEGLSPAKESEQHQRATKSKGKK